MIDKLIQWSLANRLLVLALAALLCAWGALEAWRLPVDVFPDLSAPVVTVIVDAHAVATEEMEISVTLPIEAAISGAAGVRRVRSSTATGVAIIRVEFDWDTDPYRARQIVSERLQTVSAELPAEVATPMIAPMSSIMGEIMFVALTGQGVEPAALKTAADWQVRKRLLAVPGVAQVVAIGGDTRQFQVSILPGRLKAYGIAHQDVVTALRQANDSSSAGVFIEGGQESLVRGLGRIERIEDIEQAVVAMRAGHPVRIEDLARVELGAAFKRGEGSFNAQPSVILAIQKQPEANTLALTAALDGVLVELQRGLGEGMRLEFDIFRQADFIERAVDNVSHALRDGAILVVLIVLLFLWSARATLITALAIPLSLLASVLVLKFLGMGFNTMTLGGMAIAVGALVDDAIIDVENVVRRLRERALQPPEERRPLLEVVFLASKEIRQAIVFATLIIILVFTPLFFLHGVEARLLQPLGIAYIASLVASLLIALTVTPVLCSMLLPNSRLVARGEEPTLARRLRETYGKVLYPLVPRWRTLSAVSLLALAVALSSMAFVGRAFLPAFNEGALTISAVTLPGTSLAQSDELGRLVEQTLLGQPEVVATSRRTGRAEMDEHDQGINASEIDVALKMASRSEADLLAALRHELEAIPGVNITIGQPISHRIDHMLSGTRANIAVVIQGPELGELRSLMTRAQEAMADVRGVVDLSAEQQVDLPEIHVRLRRFELARYGLSAHSVTETLEVIFGSHGVGRVVQQGVPIELVVREDGQDRRRFEDFNDIMLRAPDGAFVPLSSVAEIQRNLGPASISREGARRSVTITCNVAGRDLVSTVEDIKARLVGIERPAGYDFHVGGQFEAAERASRLLFWLSLLAVAGVLLLLYAAFGAWRDALLVMLNLPLALIGGALGVWIAGGVLSVAEIIGFITLFGIATRNGIMMVAHIRHLRATEAITDTIALVRRGAEERLVPILMTALASGLGLLPLAMAIGEPGSEIQAPMAIVILAGLTSSTLLNMFVLPALYLRFGEACQPQI
ncbi:MAG: efflux RND transporter permease subunit [Bradymonadaceae bacterium]|nr:efflux RND transporter permease subunit [Lujinxingiaceae bacterium]